MSRVHVISIWWTETKSRVHVVKHMEISIMDMLRRESKENGSTTFRGDRLMVKNLVLWAG